LGLKSERNSIGVVEFTGREYGTPAPLTLRFPPVRPTPLVPRRRSLATNPLRICPSVGWMKTFGNESGVCCVDDITNINMMAKLSVVVKETIGLIIVTWNGGDEVVLLCSERVVI